MHDENAIDRYPHATAAAWRPEFPPGRIDRIYLHWSAHPYDRVFPAYHYCVATNEAGELVVVNTHDLRENMRDVAADPHVPYAAHTRGRNSFAAGISAMGMQDAVPADFGPYPLNEELIDGLCLVAARLAEFYGVPVDADHILTHAEAAVADGYFGAGGPDQRWDIARLRPDPRPLVESDAAAAGDELRARVFTYLKNGPGRP